MTEKRTASLHLDWFCGIKTLCVVGACVTWERTGVYKGNRPTGRSRNRWEDYIKMSIKYVGSEDVAWIDLAEYTDKWQAFVQVVMNIFFP